MADTATSDFHTPFGGGAILGDTFSIFFRKIHYVALLGFIPALIDVLLSSVFENTDFESVPGVDFDWAAFSATLLFTVLVSMIAIAFTSAMVIQLAYDAKSERVADHAWLCADCTGHLALWCVRGDCSGHRHR